MAQQPPPPPPPPGSYGRPGAARPGVITAVAVLLFVGGGFGVLGGLILLGAGGGFTALGLVIIAISAVQIYAGVQVLALRERGRKLAIALAAISAVLQLISIGRATGSSIIGIAIDAFIIWACVTNADRFHQ